MTAWHKTIWVCQSYRSFTRRHFSARTSAWSHTDNKPSASDPSSSALPSTAAASGLAKLTNRRAIALHGQDAVKFLQGLVSQDMRTVSTHGVYSAILSAPGRVLHDIFIYPAHNSNYYKSSISRNLSHDDPAYIIEYDSSMHKHVYKYLKRYVLRAKVDIKPLDEEAWGVWSVWQPPSSSSSAFPLWTKYNAIANLIGCTDPRAPTMGQRFLLPSKLDTRSYLEQNLPPTTPPPPSDTTLTAYTIHRMLHGIPEGPAEIISEVALPLESNLDLTSAISLHKGCYVGQELTVRTAHTGVVRKRILPVMLYDSVSDAHPPAKLHYDPSSLAESLDATTIPHESSIIPSIPLDPTERQAARLERKRSQDLSSNRNLPTGQQSRSGRASRAAGKWLNGVGNIGLALCRVDLMTDLPISKFDGPGTEPNASGGGFDAEGAIEAAGEAYPERQFQIVWEEGAEPESRKDRSAKKANVKAARGEKMEIGAKAFVPDWMRANWKVKTRGRRV